MAAAGVVACGRSDAVRVPRTWFTCPATALPAARMTLTRHHAAVHRPMRESVCCRNAVTTTELDRSAARDPMARPDAAQPTSDTAADRLFVRGVFCIQR